MKGDKHKAQSPSIGSKSAVAIIPPKRLVALPLICRLHRIFPPRVACAIQLDDSCGEAGAGEMGRCR